jgi:DNA-directed RNA polymerase specialized sigma24 family protein
VSKRARFDELVRTHGERLHRLAWRLLGGDDQGARDVVQRAFTAAWHDVERQDDPTPWLTRLVVNETRGRHRPPPSPRIHAAVAQLSESEREVFVLVHLEGHTLAQTSEISGASQHDLHRAFEHLRHELADLGMNDRDLLEAIRTDFRPSPLASWAVVRPHSRRRAKVVVLAVLVVAAFFAWPRSTEHEAHLVPPSEEVALPTTLQGWVTTMTGSSVAGAMVTAGESTVLTEADGAFAIPDLPPQDVQVTVRAVGLSTGEARVDSRRPLTLQLLPVTGRASIDAATGGTVADKTGFSLVVPPDSFPGLVGPIDVEWTLLRDAGSLGAAPAPLATERDLLESFGMVEVRFARNGAPIELRGTAELTWPLVAHAPSVAGLYFYDREAGVWRDDGEASITKGRVHAKVTHLSWWTCGRPIEEHGCVAGRFDGPLSSTIYLEGDDDLTRVATAPGHDGKFCVDAMPQRAARLFAKSRVGDRCYVSSERVVSSAAGTSCAIDRSECASARLWSTEVACPQTTPWRGSR